MNLHWPEDVREKLQNLLSDTPPGYRKYADDAHFAAEIEAKKLGKSEIDEDAMIRGYITSVPRHLRDGLYEILSQHNIDVMYYRPVFDEAMHTRPNTAPHQD